MCIFCVGDDRPFYLRKSTAFPGKFTAEPVPADASPCGKAKAALLGAGQDETPVEAGSSNGRAGVPPKHNA
jgi:hypothetical protein